LIKVAVTGVLGSGKSTLAKILKDFGLPVLDADELSRNLVLKGSEVYNKIIKIFGNEILDSDGQIDRKALAKIVFNDKEKRLILESLIHPEVKKSFEYKTKELKEKGENMVVLDIPLLFEAKMEDVVDVVILAYAGKDTIFDRVRKRDNMSEEEIMLRLENQISLEEKVKKSHYVVNTEKSIEDLKSELHKIISEIRNNIFSSHPY